jgi:hypothetical protein
MRSTRDRRQSVVAHRCIGSAPGINGIVTASRDKERHRRGINGNGIGTKG